MWHGKLTYELLIVHTYNDLASTMTRCVESLENVKLVVLYFIALVSPAMNQDTRLSQYYAASHHLLIFHYSSSYAQIFSKSTVIGCQTFILGLFNFCGLG